MVTSTPPPHAAQRSLSISQARRIALGAQGFARPRPEAVGTRQLRGTIERLGLLQLDSVNVFERSHYLPVFARLGGYDKALLDRLTFARGGQYIEYWAHEAAVIPIESWPLMRWRMQRYRDDSARRVESWSHDNGPMLEWLLAELADKGPLPASAIEHDANKRSGPWWGWSDVKRGLETLFRWGDVVSAGRTRFERSYALPEQVLPASIIDRIVPEAAAHRQLIERASIAHGVGTASDLADYYRLKTADALAAIHSLVEEGTLLPVTVEGWRRGSRDIPAWMHRDAVVPRRIDTTALLSPFDPVVWERPRAERLFDFHYRIEIYTPAHKRVYGYYSLPLLIDDRVVGRVDLKNDRQQRVLRVQAAWQEEGAPEEAAARLAPLLNEIAAWQHLERIEVVPRGNLASALTAELGA